MQKTFLCLLGMSVTSAFAVSTASAPTSSATIAANPACTKALTQREAYRQKIIKSFHSGDACTMGNTSIQLHSLIQENLNCFPKYRKDGYNLFMVLDKTDTSLMTFPAKCDKPRAIITGNNQKIKQALLANDGCSAGKAELASYKLVQTNGECFVKAIYSPENFMKAIDTLDANKAPGEEFKYETQ